MNEALQLHSYKDLQVWQKGVDLVVAIYELTARFPSTERYGLCSQMQRAAISIPSNVAEGRRRGSRKDFLNFVTIAYASGAELETQLIILKRLSFGKDLDTALVDQLLDSVMRMLNRLRLSLKTEQANKRTSE